MKSGSRVLLFSTPKKGNVQVSLYIRTKKTLFMWKKKTILVSLCCYEADKMQTEELDAHRRQYRNSGTDPHLLYISGPRQDYAVLTPFLSGSSDSLNLCILPWAIKIQHSPLGALNGSEKGGCWQSSSSRLSCSMALSSAHDMIYLSKSIIGPDISKSFYVFTCSNLSTQLSLGLSM